MRVASDSLDSIKDEESLPLKKNGSLGNLLRSLTPRKVSSVPSSNGNNKAFESSKPGERGSFVSYGNGVVEREVSNGLRTGEESMWETLPDHILSHILNLLLDSENSWPGRASVVAATGVCRRWRRVAVQACLSKSWRELRSQVAITHPLQLLETGPRMEAVKCFIKREKVSKGFLYYYKYSLYIVDEYGYGGGKFLMSAKTSPAGKVVISFARGDGKSSAIGCLKMKKRGKSFSLYPCGDIEVAEKGVPLVCITYEHGESGMGPRKIEVTTKVGTCVGMREQANEGNNAPLDAEVAEEGDQSEGRPSFEMKKEKCETIQLFSRRPKWQPNLKCWCLDFQGRVTQASVKNMQLCMDQEDEENALQFGKVGRNMFTLDFGHPFSALTAFAVAISSFHARTMAS